MKTHMSAVLLCSVLSSGCAFLGSGSGDEPEEVGSDPIVTTPYVDGAPSNPILDFGLMRSRGIYLSNGKMEERKSPELISLVGFPGLIAKKPQTIEYFASSFRDMTGLSVEVARDVYSPRSSDEEDLKVFDSSSPELIPEGADDWLPNKTYRANATDTVEKALDHVVGKFGLSWRFDTENKTIEIYRYENSFFEIPIPRSSRSSGIDLSAGTITSTINLEQNTHEKIMETVSKLLSDEGRSSLSESGVLSVSDLKMNVSAVQKYLDKEIKNLGRQVSIKARILTENNSDSSNYGWSFELLKNSGDKLTQGVGPTNGINNGLKATVIELDSLSKYFGSSITVDALAKDNNMSVSYENDFLTLSGSPITASESRNTAYLKSVSTDTGSQSDVISTTLEPGDINTGLSLYFHPNVSGNDIYLTMGFSLSSILTLSEEVSGESRITTPETATRSTSQVVKLNSGGALAISGFYVSGEEVLNTGVGRPSFKLFGGSKLVDVEKRKAILLISASVVE